MVRKLKMGVRGVFSAQGFRQERGTGLLETVAAVGILGGVIVFFLAALTTHSFVTRSMDANDVAMNLAKTQLEDIKNMVYNTGDSYPVCVTAPAGYTVAVTVTKPQGGSTLQLVTVSVMRGSTTYLSVEMYKANLTNVTGTPTC